jgi:hypothetical protein
MFVSMESIESMWKAAVRFFVEEDLFYFFGGDSDRTACVHDGQCPFFRFLGGRGVAVEKEFQTAACDLGERHFLVVREFFSARVKSVGELDLRFAHAFYIRNTPPSF